MPLADMIMLQVMTEPVEKAARRFYFRRKGRENGQRSNRWSQGYSGRADFRQRRLPDLYP